jgi:ubiquitin carboxyl-terminal hydrolase 34
LIFHLKRFDFNLRTMQRSKINDYFSFPHRMDMRPYKVEHLMESPEQMQEDIYELVGILVHAGTAESGHYYSYIRERPSQGQTPNWVEFNDDTVTAFDPTCIEANCFGGPDYRGPDSGGSFQFDKSYSAYMLFYQRSSVLQAQQRELHASSKHPTKLPLARDVSNFIAEENELLIRKYCLYDEGHAPFVLRMLDNVQHINKGRCSEDHALEKVALSTTLNHLDQVVARTKDLPDFGSYMSMLNHRIQACIECARDVLEWVVINPEALRQLLFRNPDPMVRNEIASAIIHALSKVKQDATYPCYGLYDDSLDCDDDESDPEYRNPRVFIRVLNTLKRFWEAFHLSARAWPEYFGLLVNMAQLGTHETATLLDSGFLRRAMEVISADPQLPQHPQYSRMLQIISKRPATKPVSYENVIALLEVLLKACDLNADPIPDEDSRLDLLLDDQPMPLNQAESTLMGQHWTRGPVSILVDKLLLINQNERSTQAIIAMLLHGPNFVHQPVFFAIRTGIRKLTTNASVAPFLRAALTYCEHTDSEKCMESMITHITNTTRLLDSTEGREYLRFFKDLLEIPNIHVQVGKDLFVRYVIDQIPTWAPSLLTYYDAIVRTDTEDYVQQTVLRYAMEQNPDASPEAQENTKVMKEIARSLGVSCLKYLHDEHVRPRMQAVRATLLSIHAIIEQCRRLYNETEGDETDRDFYDYYQCESSPSGASLWRC